MNEFYIEIEGIFLKIYIGPLEKIHLIYLIFVFINFFKAILVLFSFLKTN